MRRAAVGAVGCLERSLVLAMVGSSAVFSVPETGFVHGSPIVARSSTLFQASVFPERTSVETIKTIKPVVGTWTHDGRGRDLSASVSSLVLFLASWEQ